MLQPGLMMDRPLLVSGIIEHGAAQFGDVEIVSRETHGPLFRYTYAQCALRARKLPPILRKKGSKQLPLFVENRACLHSSRLPEGQPKVKILG